VLIVEQENEISNLNRFDVLEASNSEVVPLSPLSNTSFANTFINGSGAIIKYEHPTIFIKATANNEFDVLPTGGKTEITLSGSNTSFFVTSISSKNNSAFFEIETLGDQEEVSIITDFIQPFLNVPLNSTNYGMSGTGAEDLNTQLKDAFVPILLTIGEIDTIVYNSGSNYENEVRSVVRQPNIVKFDKKDLIFRFENVDLLLQTGDLVTQEIQIEDLTYQSNTVPYTARAEFIKRVGDDFYFRQKSFYGFDEDLPVVIRNNSYSLISIDQDENSEPMGLNAEIIGETSFVAGKIEAVKVVSSGVRYTDGETVELVDKNGDVAATATIEVRGQGTLQADWKTQTSFLNNSTSVLRDNLYYQEYSYDVSSMVRPELYENFLNKFVAVAGTKLFNSTLINSNNNFDIEIEPQIEVWEYYTANTELEQNTSVVTTEEGDLVLNEYIELSSNGIISFV
jgi:hypothetical protein